MHSVSFFAYVRMSARLGTSMAIADSVALWLQQQLGMGQVGMGHMATLTYCFVACQAPIMIHRLPGFICIGMHMLGIWQMRRSATVYGWPVKGAATC